MADEQDWALYTDQGHVAATDTFLLRTAAGAGVEVAGAHVVARRADGGPYMASGPIIIDGGAAANSTALMLDNDYAGSAYTWLVWRNLNTVKASIRANVYGGDDMVFATGVNTDRMKLDGSRLAPTSDSALALGSGSFRWSTVYAATGTINTSDGRAKQFRPADALTASHLRAARRIAGVLRWYQWIEEIDRKGEDQARWHFGASAQAVARILIDEGIEQAQDIDLPADQFVPEGQRPSFRTALLCFDTWDRVPGIPETKEVRGPDGKVLAPGMPSVSEQPAGNRFGLRIDQLALFLLAAQEQRLAALEAISEASV